MELPTSLLAHFTANNRKYMICLLNGKIFRVITQPWRPKEYLDSFPIQNCSIKLEEGSRFVDRYKGIRGTPPGIVVSIKTQSASVALKLVSIER